MEWKSNETMKIPKRVGKFFMEKKSLSFIFLWQWSAFPTGRETVSKSHPHHHWHQVRVSLHMSHEECVVLTLQSNYS